MTGTTLETVSKRWSGADGDAPEAPVLVLLWSTKEPWRAGEVLAPPPHLRGPCIFGRGSVEPDDRYERIVLTRPRPGGEEATALLADPFVSRAHWKIAVEGDGLRIENLGRRALILAGEETSSGLAQDGDLVEIGGHLLFMCRRRAPFAPLRDKLLRHPFGEADADGIVGESPVAWALRDDVAFHARRHGHVLVTGPSGSGKELVARSIHARSARGGKRFVARSAATIPPGLVDAELFGNVANYPNAGMPERPGLVGEADGGTLFLDEIGEMPSEAQAHLLRVLDAGGEYQRLGDAKRRTADLRLVAATNRSPDLLKHDFLARFPLRLHVPGLDVRREDVPLLVRHILRAEAARDAHVGEALFEGWDGKSGEPRVALPLIAALVNHDYATHARELVALVWRAIAASRGPLLALTGELRAELEAGRRADASLRPAEDVTPDEIRAALAKHRGVRERVWKELGLSSRHVLTRLLRRHGLDGEE